MLHRVLRFVAVVSIVAAGCSAPRPVLTAPDRIVDDGPPAGDPVAGELRIAIVGAPVLDPLAASPVSPTDMVVVDLLYDGLTAWDPATGTWVPALASSLEQSADGLSWTVDLGPATFSDGTPLTADDVARSFGRLLQAQPALAATRLEMVDDVVAIDRATVRFELSSPFALLPALLSSPVYGVVPDGAVDGRVGSGPMMARGDGVLVPRPGLALGIAGVRLVDTVDEAAAVAQHRARELDLVHVSMEHRGPVDATAVGLVETHYALNTRSLALADPAARRAVVAAVSNEAVVDSVYGSAATSIDGIGGPGGEEAADPVPGSGEVSPLTLAYVSEPAGAAAQREAALAAAVVDQLAAAGIEATVTGYDLAAFVQRAADGADDLVRTGWVGLAASPDSALAPYSAASADNITGFDDPAFDELLGLARRSGDAADYATAANHLRDAAVVIPVARLRVRALVSERTEGLVLRPDGTFAVESVAVAVSGPG